MKFSDSLITPFCPPETIFFDVIHET